MATGPHHEIADLRCAVGELSFMARIGGREQQVWLRTDTAVTPNADAALAACLMPAMRFGGTLTVPAPVSPRVLRNQREFQSIQQAWSHGWTFGDPPLEEVEVVAPPRAAEPRPEAGGRVAAFFSGGVDSWSTVLDHPELTDLIFVRGFDLLPGMAHQADLADEVESRLREAAEEIGRLEHNQITASHTTIAQAAAFQAQHADASAREADEQQQRAEMLTEKCSQFTRALGTALTLIDELMRENGRLCAASSEPPNVKLFTAKNSFDAAMKKLLRDEDLN